MSMSLLTELRRYYAPKHPVSQFELDVYEQDLSVYEIHRDPNDARGHKVTYRRGSEEVIVFENIPDVVGLPLMVEVDRDTEPLVE